MSKSKFVFCAQPGCGCEGGCYVGPPVYGPVKEYIVIPNEFEPPPQCYIEGVDPAHYFLPQTAVIVRHDTYSAEPLPEHLIERVGEWEIDGGLTSTDSGWRVITYDGDVSHLGIRPRAFKTTLKINESGGQAGLCIRWGGSASTSDFILFQAGPAKMIFVENGSVLAEADGIGPAVGAEFQVEIQVVKRTECDPPFAGEDNPLNHYLHIRINEAGEGIDPNVILTYDVDPEFQNCIYQYLDWGGWPFAADSAPVEQWGLVIGDTTTDAVFLSSMLLSEPRTVRTDWRNPDAELEEPVGTIWYPSEENIAPPGLWKTESSDAVLVANTVSKDGTFKIEAAVRFCDFGTKARLLARGDENDSNWTELTLEIIDVETARLELVGVDGEGVHSIDFERTNGSGGIADFEMPLHATMCLSLTKIRNHPGIADEDSVRGHWNCGHPTRPKEVTGGISVFSREEVGFIDKDLNRWGIGTGTVTDTVSISQIAAWLTDPTLLERCVFVGEDVICYPVERCPQCGVPHCSCCYHGTIPQQILFRVAAPAWSDTNYWNWLHGGGWGYDPPLPLPPGDCGNCREFSAVLTYAGAPDNNRQHSFEFPCRWIGKTTESLSWCIWNAEDEQWDVLGPVTVELTWQAWTAQANVAPFCAVIQFDVEGTGVSEDPRWSGGVSFHIQGTLRGKDGKDLVNPPLPGTERDCRWVFTRTEEDTSDETCLWGTSFGELLQQCVSTFVTSGSPNPGPGYCQRKNYLGAWDSTGPASWEPNASDWADPDKWEVATTVEVIPLDGGGQTYDPEKAFTKWIVALRECGADPETEPFYLACTRPPPADQTGVGLNVPGIGPVCFEIVEVKAGAICQDMACEVPIFLDCPAAFDLAACECE